MNIFLIIVGYNDVSWHNSDILSPNLDKLAKSGIILENHYVQPICTPTRSALLTGYYPIHTGRQVRYFHVKKINLRDNGYNFIQKFSLFWYTLQKYHKFI